MDELNELLQEAFHTYQIYLECTQVLNSGPHISLLKWPDIAQAAIAWGQAIANQRDVASTRAVLRSDLITAVIAPVEAVHESTRQRIKEVAGVFPPIKINRGTRYEQPVSYKNDVIAHINDMFATLETLSEIKYPAIRRRDGSVS
jgi:hypothetical protein